MFLFGYLLQDVLIKPIFKAEKDVREPITVIIVTTGLWYILDNLSLLIFGPQYRTIPDNPLRGKMLEFGDMMISVPKLWGFCAAILTALIVYAFLQKTRMGRAVRATTKPRRRAYRASTSTRSQRRLRHRHGRPAWPGWRSCRSNIFPSVGVLFDINCFIIVVLVDSGASGALLGGMIVGVIESVGPQFMTATWTEAIVYGLFLVFLFLKPSGLFGVKYDW
jgi:branched-chain amino acid transport system permease protein